MSVFEPSSRCQTDEANSRQMAQEEKPDAPKQSPPSVGDSLWMTEKAIEQVLVLRQVGTRMMAALAAWTTSEEIAQCVTEITEDAEGKIEDLKGSMDMLGTITEKVNASSGLGHSGDNNLVKVWRNASVVEKQSKMQHACQCSLEKFQREKEQQLERSQRWKRMTGMYNQGMMAITKDKSHTAEIKAITARVSEVSGLRLFLAASNGSLTQDSAAADEVRIVCPHVFAAAVALCLPGSTAPVRVVVDSFENARAVDGWSQPSHYVFQRATELANVALHYFWDRQNGEPGSTSEGWPAGLAALEDLLLWICSLRDMFEVPCSITGTLLAADPTSHKFLPPIFRKFRLPRSRLQEAAMESGRREGYHLHFMNVL